MGRGWTSPRRLHQIEDLGGFIGPGRGVDNGDEVSLALLYDLAEQRLQPVSSPFTLWSAGLHEGHAAKRGLRSRASVNPEVTWPPLPEVGGLLLELHV